MKKAGTPDSTPKNEENEEVAREANEESEEQLWTDEDDRRFSALERSVDWRDAVNLLNDWLAEETHPIRRYHIAKQARYHLHDRLWNHMGKGNRKRFKVEYEDIAKDMEHVMAEAEAAWAAQQGGAEVSEGNGSVPPEARKIITRSPFSTLVRVFEAMRVAGIISPTTPVKDIVAHCFKEGSAARVLEDNYNATKQKIGEGSKAKGKEILELMKALAPSLKSTEIDDLIAELDKLRKG